MRQLATIRAHIYRLVRLWYRKDFGRLVGPVLDDVFVIDFRARD